MASEAVVCILFVTKIFQRKRAFSNEKSFLHVVFAVIALVVLVASVCCAEQALPYHSPRFITHGKLILSRPSVNGLVLGFVFKGLSMDLEEIWATVLQ